MVGPRLRALVVGTAATVAVSLPSPASATARGDWEIRVEHDLDSLEYDPASARPRTFFRFDCDQDCDVSLTVKRKGRVVLTRERLSTYHGARLAWRCSRTGRYSWSATDGERTQRGTFKLGVCRRKHRHYVSRRHAKRFAKYATGNGPNNGRNVRCRPASRQRGRLAWRWDCRFTLGQCDYQDPFYFKRLFRFGYVHKFFGHDPRRERCRSS